MWIWPCFIFAIITDYPNHKLEKNNTVNVLEQKSNAIFDRYDKNWCFLLSQNSEYYINILLPKNIGS